MNKDAFDIIILVGRPASGKSEIIDYLLNTQPNARRRLFHIGDLGFIDDFPMLWTWFEEDHILEKTLGQPRLHTDADGNFKHEYLWHLLIERISLEQQKLLRDRPDYYELHTTIVEFARGTQHGGYAAAFAHLSPAILERAALLYVNVSFEESLRKNRKRFNPDRPDSILEHALPDEKLRHLYSGDDFLDLVAADDTFITINGTRVPYAIFENEDDVTSGRGDALGDRLQETLAPLWTTYHQMHGA